MRGKDVDGSRLRREVKEEYENHHRGRMALSAKYQAYLDLRDIRSQLAHGGSGNPEKNQASNGQ